VDEREDDTDEHISKLKREHKTLDMCDNCAFAANCLMDEKNAGGKMEPTSDLVYNIVYAEVPLNLYQRLQIASSLAKLAGHDIEAHRIRRGMNIPWKPECDNCPYAANCDRTVCRRNLKEDEYEHGDDDGQLD
jgi:hypothetical protein